MRINENGIVSFAWPSQLLRCSRRDNKSSNGLKRRGKQENKEVLEPNQMSMFLRDCVILIVQMNTYYNVKE